MTKGIMIAVVFGILAGAFVIPDAFMAISGKILIAGLCVLLFFVGVDLGKEGTVVQNFKKVGLKILVFPAAVVVGTLVAAAVSSLVLPITAREAMAAGAGFGWYTLAPAILVDYSTELSAIAFLHNVMRELAGIILIPIVAKRIGYLECTALPGAAAMDVCIPIVEKCTRSDMVVYSFIVGVSVSFLVPILVPFIAGI